MTNTKKIQETRRTLARVFLDVDDVFRRLYSLNEDLSNLRTEVTRLVHFLIPEARNLPFKVQTEEILRKIAGRTTVAKDPDDIRKPLDEVGRKTRKRRPKKAISRTKGS